jgi:hypothetical protein
MILRSTDQERAVLACVLRHLIEQQIKLFGFLWSNGGQHERAVSRSSANGPSGTRTGCALCGSPLIFHLLTLISTSLMIGRHIYEEVLPQTICEEVGQRYPYKTVFCSFVDSYHWPMVLTLAIGKGKSVVCRRMADLIQPCRVRVDNGLVGASKLICECQWRCSVVTF